MRQALACGNVLRFFKLYSAAPLLSRRLMDAGVKQLRYKALCALVRTHKPTALPLPFISTALGFTSTTSTAGGGGSGGSVSGVGGVDAAGAGVTVDSAGVLLPGCSEQRCVGEYAPAGDVQEGLAACLQWCKRHGAVFDQETGENRVLMGDAGGGVCVVCCVRRQECLFVVLQVPSACRVPPLVFVLKRRTADVCFLSPAAVCSAFPSPLHPAPTPIPSPQQTCVPRAAC